PLARQVQAAQVAVVGQRRSGAYQLQRRRLPETLADAGDHGFADIPGLAAVLRLPFRRRHDAYAFADEVDAGALAESVLAHPPGEAVDAHVHREPVVIGVDRGRDRLAQVGPAMAAGVRIAIAAALAGNVELARGHDPVFRGAQPAVEAGQRDERLHGGTRWPAAEHVAVEQRARRVVHQRPEILVRTAVDEQVRVVGRQADHGAVLAGARVDCDSRTVKSAERLARRLLQAQVDRQAPVSAGPWGHACHRAQGAAVDVGLDALVTHLAAQDRIVIALDAGLADVGERTVGLAQALQVLLVHAAHVANDMRGQFGVRIAAVEIGHQLHAGEAPAV